jgi:hypothetical protein
VGTGTVLIRYDDGAELLLAINDAIEAAADRKAKGVIIRRIRDALKSGADEWLLISGRPRVDRDQGAGVNPL